MSATQRDGEHRFTVNAAGQTYFTGGSSSSCSVPGSDRVPVGGGGTGTSNRIGRSWAVYGRNGESVFDRRGLTTELKARLLQAEVVETLLYGCTTWSLSPSDYTILRCRGTLTHYTRERRRGAIAVPVLCILSRPICQDDSRPQHLVQYPVPREADLPRSVPHFDLRHTPQGNTEQLPSHYTTAALSNGEAWC